MEETARAGLGDREPARSGYSVSPERDPPAGAFPDGAPREPRVMSPVSGRWYREPLAVADLMTREVKTVSPETPLSDVATLMRDEDVGVVPVVDGAGRLNGIVTDRDLVVRALAGGDAEFPGQRPGEVRAAQVSTKDVEAVSPHDAISDVLHLLGRKQIRRVPVVDSNRRLIGMISLGDIAKHADNDQELQDALQRISARRSFWSRVWR
ncbi:MAG TPA: CBS domain-containing protein [Polyangia bacterium]|nr:CBS domain-containing protein [Polyangia bacterium]